MVYLDAVLIIIVMGLILFGIDMLAAKINPTLGRIVSVLSFFVMSPVGLAAGIVALVFINKKAEKRNEENTVNVRKSKKTTSVTIPQKAAVTQTAKKNADVTVTPAKKAEPKKEKYPTKRRRIAEDTKATSCVPKASMPASKPNPGDEKEWKLEYATSIDDLHMRMIGYPFPEDEAQNKEPEKLIEMVIPEGTTEIRKYEYENRKDIASVVISEGVKTIGEGAFKDCENLTSIVIPESVKIIAADAFWNCKRLGAIHIDDLSKWFDVDFKGNYSNPLRFGGKLFFNGELLTELTIHGSVTKINSRALMGCAGLKKVRIHNEVTDIGESAFCECTDLETVVLPDGLEEIKYWVFKGCRSLSEVNIPNSVKCISANAFEECKNLTTIDLPENLEKIGMYAFADCKSLSAVVIPESVKEIGDSAFEHCEKLVSAVLPNGLRKIESDTFVGCTSLKNVFIPDSVNYIKYRAFLGCESLVDIELPKELKEIGTLAFCRCKALEKISIPRDINTIGENAFSNCENLITVEFLRSVGKFIEPKAFSGCDRLDDNSMREIAFKSKVYYPTPHDDPDYFDESCLDQDYFQGNVKHPNHSSQIRIAENGEWYYVR